MRFLFDLIKVSKKRLGKYEKEYLQMKEEMELKEDPVERLQVRISNYSLIVLLFNLVVISSSVI